MLRIMKIKGVPIGAGRDPENLNFCSLLQRLSRISTGDQFRRLSTEVASATLFLLSDEASFIAGVELCVDGGMAQV